MKGEIYSTMEIMGDAWRRKRHSVGSGIESRGRYHFIAPDLASAGWAVCICQEVTHRLVPDYCYSEKGNS